MQESELKEVIDRAKAGGVSKENFKAKVLGISGNAMRLRGRTNSAKHKKQRELIFLIDALWDDTNKFKKARELNEKKARSMFRDLIIGILLIVALIVGLGFYLT